MQATKRNAIAVLAWEGPSEERRSDAEVPECGGNVEATFAVGKPHIDQCHVGLCGFGNRYRLTLVVGNADDVMTCTEQYLFDFHRHDGFVFDDEDIYG